MDNPGLEGTPGIGGDVEDQIDSAEVEIDVEDNVDSGTPPASAERPMDRPKSPTLNLPIPEGLSRWPKFSPEIAQVLALASAIVYDIDSPANVRNRQLLEEQGWTMSYTSPYLCVFTRPDPPYYDPLTTRQEECGGQVLAFRGTANGLDILTDINAFPTEFDPKMRQTRSRREKLLGVLQRAKQAASDDLKRITSPNEESQSARSPPLIKLVSNLWDGAGARMHNVFFGEALLVHTGFYNLYMDQRSHVLRQLRAIPPVDLSLGGHLYVTGHSLGGATALLAAVDLAMNEGYHPVMYTFGAPRVGNYKFAEACNELVPAYRLINIGDAIPTVPPPMSLYRHVGYEVSPGSWGEPDEDPPIPTQTPICGHLMEQFASDAHLEFDVDSGQLDDKLEKYQKLVERATGVVGAHLWYAGVAMPNITESKTL